ncbi:lipopolysaccharide biosynthesis protein [Microvirga pakistanensis]|uniref:lipopolysaccharide biosynthesis protein n=1 Tax=Microvirga pakistanensis TaxID=1682650 RepID=UPI001069A556|nr:lipopolysaccharide biosynthesis protein [Microvirga pakistanensis]
MNIRRALLLATGEQHIGLILNFCLIAVVSRLLTPAEVGISVVAAGIGTIVLSLREFATADFLIQRKNLSAEDMRTSFTILMGTGLVIALMLFAVSPWIAKFYGYRELSRILQVIALSHVLSAFSLPTMALLRRNMAFGTVAWINITVGIVGAATTVALATLKFGAISFAYGTLAGSAVTALCAVFLCQDRRMFRPSIASWRDVIGYGGYNGMSTLLDRAYEALPQLFLGRVLPVSAVGFYNRANMICGIPDRLILSGVFSVAYPAFAKEFREGRCLTESYLRAITYLTAFHWPALIAVALLAKPIVMVVLGPQWLDAVPLVQILALAGLLWFPTILTQPLLVAVGAIRHNFLSSLITRPLAAIILCCASLYGVTALAASQFIALPLQVSITLYFVRRHVPFTWREMGAAVWRSAVASLFSAAGPVAIIILSGFSFDLSIGATIAAGLLAAAGWLAGLWLTDHPVLVELQGAVDTARRHLPWSFPAPNVDPAPRAIRSTIERV